MSFIETARSRHSCRSFSLEPLSEEEKGLLLEAGRLAPSSRNRKPVTLLPVEDKGIIERLSGCREHNPALQSCTFAIVVLVDPFKADTCVEDGSIASIMIQLEAEDLGLGSCWIQVMMRDNGSVGSEDYVREVLGIEDRFTVLSIIALGHRG